MIYSLLKKNEDNITRHWGRLGPRWLRVYEYSSSTNEVFQEHTDQQGSLEIVLWY